MCYKTYAVWVFFDSLKKATATATIKIPNAIPKYNMTKCFYGFYMIKFTTQKRDLKFCFMKSYIYLTNEPKSVMNVKKSTKKRCKL
jgi:hypothetical protein